MGLRLEERTRLPAFGGNLANTIVIKTPDLSCVVRRRSRRAFFLFSEIMVNLVRQTQQYSKEEDTVVLGNSGNRVLFI